MTPRQFALLVGLLLLIGAAADAPASSAKAAMLKPAASGTTAHPSPLNIRFGDGIFRLRIQLCEACGVELSLEITFAPPGPGAAPRTPPPGSPAVNQQPSAA